MRTLVHLLPAVLLIVSVSFLKAEIINVPSQQPTIQAGIDAAVDGDTVLVADGNYYGVGNRDIDFLGKPIVVMSENGAKNCIIDCEGSQSDPHRGFYFHSEEDSNSVLKGFTIKRGYTDWPRDNGGAILCDGSSPTIMNNTIMWNTSTYGGGIYCYYSSPIIKGNTISSNTTGWGVVGWGGGINCNLSSPTITNNTITGNIAKDYGGGIFCLKSYPTITGNTITGNSVDQHGGGIFCRLSSPTITSNTITGNIVQDCGGGIYCGGSSSPTITNCILWGDSPDEIYESSSFPVVTYSGIQGGWPGEGNIDEEPMFVLADKDDYHLLWESPCIDTGDPLLFDPDGTRSDMGAHYFNQDDYLTLYLTPSKTEVSPGGKLHITYTAINRWNQPEEFWILSRILRPGGTVLDAFGPEQHTLPSNYTTQVNIIHDILNAAPAGWYKYRSAVGWPPSTIYDWDSFTFKVIE